MCVYIAYINVYIIYKYLRNVIKRDCCLRRLKEKKRERERVEYVGSVFLIRLASRHVWATGPLSSKRYVCMSRSI